MMIDVDTRDKTKLVSALEGSGSKFKGNYCTCPFHRDKNPSAGIYQSKDGHWRFKCHVCDINYNLVDVLARLAGKTTDEIVKENIADIEDPQKFTEEEIREKFKDYKYLHEYTNEKGEVTHFVAVKYINGSKEVRQCKRYGFNFIMKNNGLRPVFRLDAIKSVDTILMVEGEKCVLCAEYCGIPSTTCMGGSSAVKYSDLQPLAGKNIIIWPDNDDSGRKYSDDLQRELKKFGCSVGVIDNNSIGNTGKGFDIVDYYYKLRSEYNHEDITKIIKSVIGSVNIVDEGYDSFCKYNEAIFSGKFAELETNFPLLQEDVRYTEGGQITIICGEGGTAKSFFIGQHFMNWKLKGKKVKIWSVENNREFHSQRAFAQLLGDGRYCDKSWILNNKEEYLRTRESHKKEISEIMNMFHFSEKRTKTDLIEFCTKFAKQGYEAVAADPVTYFFDSQGKQSYEGDNEIMDALNKLVEQYHTRFYLVTHPRTKNDHDLDNLAGSRGYGRFCQNAIWLTQADKTYRQQKINKTIVTLKTRSGLRKNGGVIGFYFSPKTALFTEIVSMRDIENETKDIF